MSFRKFYGFLITSLALAFGLVPPAHAGALSVSLDSASSFVSRTENAVVRITYRNDSPADLYLLRWQTPLKGVEGNLFDVQLDGRPVEYTGRLYKRAAPKAGDYLRIPAGGTVSTDVDLSGAYDLSRTGEYLIRYRALLQDALRADGRKISGLRELTSLESNVLPLAIERDDLGDLGDRIREDLSFLETGAVKALAPSFVGCSTSRQTALRTALTNAQKIALKAKQYLAAVPTSSRPSNAAYKTWFGSYTASRYATVSAHYTTINSTFTTKRVAFYCDCDDPDTYAYVYSNRPYQIHLCGAFWDAPAQGTDSKAGTLVHEASHFNVVAGTDDYAYGQAACKTLATRFPDRAIFNADSHEYFAETR